MASGGILDWLTPGPGGILGGTGGAAPMSGPLFGPNGRLAQFRQQNPQAWNAMAAGLLAGPTLGQGMARAAAGFGQASQADVMTREDMARKTALNNLLKSPRFKSLSPEERAYYVANPSAFDPSKQDAVEKPMVVGGRLYDPRTREWIAPPEGMADTPKTSLVPFWTKGPDGKMRLFQPTETGVPKPVELPEGMEPVGGAGFLDTGTSFIPYDRKAGIGPSGPAAEPIKKDVAGEAAEKVVGTKTGEAAAGLPTALAAGDRMIRAIDDLLADPGLSRLTGPFQSWFPNVSGEANRAQGRLDQIMGATFLQAFNDLRGGGQITEKEGEKATAAYNRLSSTGMYDEDYVVALKEFRDEVVKLMEVAKNKAAGGMMAPPLADPSVNLRKKYGLE